MIGKGVKYSGEDKYTKASYVSRAQSHNDRIDNLSTQIKNKIESGDLTDEQKAALTALVNKLDAARIKLDPDSALSQKAVMEHGIKVLKSISSDFDKSLKSTDMTKIGEFKRMLRSAAESFNRDKEESEQDIKLQRAKDNIKRTTDDLERKINAGEFDIEERHELTKSDAELVRLQTEREKLQSKFREKQRDIRNANKSRLRKIFELARGLYVSKLIGGVGTLTKVAVMAGVRPTSETLTMQTTGRIAPHLFWGMENAAKRGGESSSFQVIKAGWEAYYKQMNEEGLAKLYEKVNDEYEKKMAAYEKGKTDGVGEKQLQKLKNEKDKALVASVGAMAYQFIGGSSIRDMLEAFIHRSSYIEREFGGLSLESFSDGNRLDKLNYILGFVGRSHSALKTLSGRFSFAAGFTARLEGALENGVDITNPDRILEIAHESYLDWERGKYQQSNAISDLWSKALQTFEESKSHPEIGKAIAAGLSLDVAITRVPVNVLHEAVMEYTLGSFKSVIQAGVEYYKARKIVVQETGLDFGDKGFTDAMKEQVGKMDVKTAATIFRAFRKGGIGLGIYALAALGYISFGGFYHKGQKKKTADELEPGELNDGELVIFGHKFGKLSAKVLEHVPALYPALWGIDIHKAYRQSEESGAPSLTSAYQAAIAGVNAMADAIPQLQVFDANKYRLSTLFKTPVSEIAQWNDVDKDGNYIDRRPFDFKDELKLAFGNRKDLLTEANYKVATSIQNDYKKAIRDAYKAGDSQESIEALKKERDEQIKHIYELNKQE
jgi:hypothetical protein